MTQSDKVPVSKYLITGGAGFIGRHFVDKILQEKSNKVLVLDKLTYAGHQANLRQWEKQQGYNFVQGDIGDRALIHNLITKFQPTYIVNFAAESHVDRSIEAVDDFINTNIVGTYTILDEALSYWQKLRGSKAKVFCFHHISTDEVYGSLKTTGYFHETTPYAPNSPYAASKASADHLVRAYNRTYGLPTTITNCSNNYGPFQFPEKLIPLALMNALEGKNIPVYGDGQNIRDWLYVKDHCDAIFSVLVHGTRGDTYNVGGRTEKTNLELLYSLFAALREHTDLIHANTNFSINQDYERLITFVPDRPGHDYRYAIDCSKIERELNWTPNMNLNNGLSKTAAWYITNLDWCREVTEENYNRQRLGLRKSFING